VQFKKIPGEATAFQGALQEDMRGVLSGVNAPVLFESRHEFYPCDFYVPEAPGRFYFLRADVEKEDPAVLPFEAYVLRFELFAHARVEQAFAAYRSMAVAEAMKLPAFYLVMAQHPHDRVDVDLKNLVEKRFDGYSGTRVGPDVFYVKRKGKRE
jgi:hypothetical protein